MASLGKACLLAVALSSALCVQAATLKSNAVADGSATPVSKVVELLGILQKQLEKDKAADDKIHGEYLKWYEKEFATVKKAVGDTSQNIESFKAQLQEEEAAREAFNMDLEKKVAEETRASNELSQATSDREAEHKEFEKTESDLVVGVDQFERSIEVLKKQAPKGGAALLEGSAGAVAQHASKEQLTSMARQLRETLEHSRDFSLTESQRESISELFRIAAARAPSPHLTTVAPPHSQTENNGAEEADDLALSFVQVQAHSKGAEPSYGEYESQSGGLVDTLKSVLKKTGDELERVRKDEAAAQKTFKETKTELETFVTNKQNAISALKMQMSQSAQKTGQVNSENLAADQLLKTSTDEQTKLETENKLKLANFDKRKAKRNDETLAVKEALELLTSDKAQKLISLQFAAGSAVEGTRSDSASVSPSFLQLQQGSVSSTGPALSFLATRAKTHRRSLQYRSLRMENSDDPFSKVKSMVRGMLHKLTEAQAQDTKQGAWCDSEMSKSTKEEKSRKADVQKLKDRIEEMDARLDEISDELKDTTKELSELKGAATKATELRKEESEHAATALAEYSDAQKILAKALEALKKFYNTENEDSSGGYKVSGAGSGVVGLLEVALTDYQKMYEELALNEDVAKKDFNDYMSQDQIRSEVFVKDLEYRERQKVRLSGDRMRANSDLKSYQKELDAVLAYITELKATCTIKGDSYDERKARREKELDSLKNALDFLRAENSL